MLALGFEGPRDRFDYPVSGKLNDHGVAPYLASVLRFVRAPLKGFKKILFLNTIKYILVLSTVPSVKRGVAIFLVPGPEVRHERGLSKGNSPPIPDRSSHYQGLGLALRL
jgi:hypothetical protein